MSAKSKVGTESDRFRGYRLNVVPKFWLLTQSQNFRIFEKLSVPDIINQVLNKYGISPTVRLVKTYTKWDLCTQYRETDFNFLSRLMEHEGIFYFFEYSNGNHTLVLGGTPTGISNLSRSSESYNYAPEIGPETRIGSVTGVRHTNFVPALTGCGTGTSRMPIALRQRNKPQTAVADNTSSQDLRLHGSIYTQFNAM